MIVAVYRLQLYVIPKILTELKIFQGGQGPPLSALKTVLASCVVPVYCLSFGVQ